MTRAEMIADRKKIVYERILANLTHSAAHAHMSGNELMRFAGQLAGEAFSSASNTDYLDAPTAQQIADLKVLAMVEQEDE